MIKSVTVTLLVVVYATWLIYVCDGEHPNPRGNAEEDLIKEKLPGLKDNDTNFKQYAGYLKAGDGNVTERFVYYWLVESQSKPDKDPLVFWFNGGPGCSSLNGFFEGMGPFRINKKDKTLSMNQYSWNKIANVVILDTPIGIGFSFARMGVSNKTDDDKTASANYIAVKDFFEKFPHFKKRPTYLFGESYGAVYVTTLGLLLEKDPEVNLLGIGMGNGYVHRNKLGESLIFYSYYHGLYGKELWDNLSKYCCHNKTPARGSCVYEGSNCSRYVEDATTHIMDSDLNPYNLYVPCENPKAKRQTRAADNNLAGDYLIGHDESAYPDYYEYQVNMREIVGRRLIRNSLLGGKKTKSVIKQRSTTESSSDDVRRPACIGVPAIGEYVNRPEVRKIIHVHPGIRNWDTCQSIQVPNVDYDLPGYPDKAPGIEPVVRKLLISARRPKLLFYNGDVDMICNFLGVEWFVDDLAQKVIKEHSKWMVDGQVAGYLKHYEGNMTFMIIKGAGHAVPMDQPKLALEMLTSFFKPDWP